MVIGLTWIRWGTELLLSLTEVVVYSACEWGGGGRRTRKAAIVSSLNLRVWQGILFSFFIRPVDQLCSRFWIGHFSLLSVGLQFCLP